MVAYFKNPSTFWILVAALIIGVSSAALFDDSVERAALIDDSVIVELDEGQYRFKIPVDYIHMKLVTDEFLKERTVSTENLNTFTKAVVSVSQRLIPIWHR